MVGTNPTGSGSKARAVRSSSKVVAMIMDSDIFSSDL